MPRDYRKHSKRALLEHLAHSIDEQGKTLSKLDDAVSNIAQIVTAEVDDLRAKLAQAQADDTAAAEVAADVQENVDRLDALATQLQSGQVPDAPPADQPGPDTPPAEDGTGTGDNLAPGEQPTPA